MASNLADRRAGGDDRVPNPDHTDGGVHRSGSGSRSGQRSVKNLRLFRLAVS